MKKLIALILVAVMLVSCLIVLSACNKQLFDTTYNFNYAYVVWPDGTSEKLSIKSWNDYEGEQIQIKTDSGDVYVFHAANCVLAAE